MIPEIDIDSFIAAHAGGVVLDVREPFEYVAGHVPGARLVPLAQVHAVRHEIPAGERVYVICATGNRSKTAAGWLRDAGIDAVSVATGTSGWISRGKAVVAGRQAHAGGRTP